MIKIKLIITEEGVIPERLLTPTERKTVIHTFINDVEEIHFQSNEELEKNIEYQNKISM